MEMSEILVLSPVRCKEPNLNLSVPGMSILQLLPNPACQILCLDQALGVCFNPYNAFLNLYTRWGCFSLSNPSGCLTYTSSSNTPFKKALFTSIWYNLNTLATEKAKRILIASKRATGAKVSS
jgi:hypothetical protein